MIVFPTLEHVKNEVLGTGSERGGTKKITKLQNFSERQNMPDMRVFSTLVKNAFIDFAELQLT